MEDVLQLVVLDFLYAVTRYADVIVLQQLGHNLALDDTVVALCALTVDHLHLQLSQFVTTARIAGGLLQQIMDLGVQAADPGIKPEHPPYQGALAYTLVGRLQVDIHQQAELVDAEEIKQREGDGAHHQLLVIAVDGRRQEHLLEGVGNAVGPEPGRPDVVKEVGHQLLMPFVEVLLVRCPDVLRLQLQHGHVGDEGFQVVTQRRRRPVAASVVARPMVNARDERAVADVVADVDIRCQDEQAAQQTVVELATLGVVVALLPVVGHQAVVALDELQLFCGLRLRKGVEIILKMADGPP